MIVIEGIGNTDQREAQVEKFNGKKLNELSSKEILKMINTLDKAMFGQPYAKQQEIAKAIGILIKTHKAVEAEYRKQNTPFTLEEVK